MRDVNIDVAPPGACIGPSAEVVREVQQQRPALPTGWLLRSWRWPTLFRRSRDSTVREGNVISRDRALVGPIDAELLSVAITPDGNHIVSGGVDRTVRVWDLASGRLEDILQGHAGPVTAVGITPDGDRIISGSGDGTVRLWNLGSGRLERTLLGHAGSVLAVAASPDGQRIVSGGFDCTVRVWDLHSGRAERTLTGHTRPVQAVAVTPDGHRIISGGGGDWDFGHDDTVRVWDLASGVLEHTMSGHTDSVCTVAVTPDGEQIISGSDDQTVRLWDLSSGRLSRTLEGNTGGVWAVTVTPNGRRITTAGLDGSVRVWDLTTGTELTRWDTHAVLISCCAIYPGDPITLVYGDLAGQVVTLTVRTCVVCDTVDLSDPSAGLIDRVNKGQMRYIRGDVPLEDMYDLAASDMKYTIVSYLQCLACRRTRFWGLCIRGAPVYRVADPDEPHRHPWGRVPDRALWKREHP